MSVKRSSSVQFRNRNSGTRSNSPIVEDNEDFVPTKGWIKFHGQLHNPKTGETTLVPLRDDKKFRKDIPVSYFDPEEVVGNSATAAKKRILFQYLNDLCESLSPGEEVELNFVATLVRTEEVEQEDLSDWTADFTK